VLEKIGNSLVTFYKVDLSFQETGYCGTAQILVGQEVSKGLAKSMDIKRGVDIFHLNLDYKGIPFICVHCQYYGHLVIDCNYPSMRKNWVLRKHLIRLETLELENTSRKEDVGVQATSDGLQSRMLITDAQNTDNGQVK
jgi:hypothetical protein